MTTATTTTAVSMASSATFQTWVTELIAQFLAVGLTQTADTGQMANPCTAALPGAASTSAGYYILAFNDAQSKGVISTTVNLTAGTGYNGGSTSGTFTGVALTGGTGTGALGTVVVNVTGNITAITVTTPGTGYVVGDTLTVTSASMVAAGAIAGGSGGSVMVGALLAASAQPVVIKLEAGTAANAAYPQIWMTIGTSTNGAGTLGGIVMTRVATCSGAVFASPTTAYVSHWCYYAPQGVFSFAWKTGAISGGFANTCYGGGIIFRSVNTVGAPTGDTVHFLTNSTTASGSSSNNGSVQIINYNLSVAVISGTGPINAGGAWGAICFGSTSTLEGSSSQCFPCWQYVGTSALSGYGVTNAHALAALGDLGLGSTTTITILGALSLTYMSVGSLVGTVTNLTTGGYAVQNFTQLIIWQ